MTEWRKKNSISFFLIKNYLPDFLIMQINNVHYKKQFLKDDKSNHNTKSNR